MNVDGTLVAYEDRWEIRFTRALPHAPEKVWRALTEPEHLAAWFPDRVVGNIAPGASLRFEYGDDEGQQFDGKVITFDPPRVLELVWADDTLRFELTPDGNGTALTLVDTIHEVGKAARDTAGWHVCLDRLAVDLDGGAASPDAVADWKPLSDAYVERFGPEASTIGPPEGHPAAS